MIWLAYFSWMPVRQLERAHLHDRHDRRVLADELSLLNQPLGHRTRNRRLDDGVAELLLRQIERCPAILEAGLQRARVVDRRFVVRFGDLQASVGRIVIDLRQEAAAVELLGARIRRARVVPIGCGLANRRDLLVRRRLAILRSLEADLGFDLTQRALGALERELELPRLQSHQDVAGANFRTKLDKNLANDPGDLTADLGLIGREQRA